MAQFSYATAGFRSEISVVARGQQERVAEIPALLRMFQAVAAGPHCFPVLLAGLANLLHSGQIIGVVKLAEHSHVDREIHRTDGDSVDAVHGNDGFDILNSPAGLDDGYADHALICNLHVFINVKSINASAARTVSADAGGRIPAGAYERLRLLGAIDKRTQDPRGPEIQKAADLIRVQAQRSGQRNGCSVYRSLQHGAYDLLVAGGVLGIDDQPVKPGTPKNLGHRGIGQRDLRSQAHLAPAEFRFQFLGFFEFGNQESLREMYVFRNSGDKLGSVWPKLFVFSAAIITLFFLFQYAVGSNETAVFQDRAASAGLSFRLENFATDQKYLVETMTGGCAFLDYDRDGLLDIFLVNGAAIEARRFNKSDPRYWNRLYRNEGNGKFRDVTEAAGVQGSGYGLGVAVGDYDNDGYPDLYVTNYGRNELFHNERNGRFREVAASAGVEAGGFSTSAVFLDYDRDGYLDLFVARYVDWSFDNNVFCGIGPKRDYCHPQHFRGETNLLFRNNRDGTFRDVSEETGAALPSGKSLGVAIADLDRDGWPDIYVANDSVPEFVLHNRLGKKFEEIGLQSGAALTADGRTFAGMGVDFADYDNDGWPDVFVTALSLEGFVLFRNQRDLTFADESQPAGVKKPTFYLSGWGTKMVDFDNDGWKDLFAANSHVMRGIGESIRTISYLQPLLMLQNRGSRFEDVSAALGAPFRQKWAARGAAFGDYDNDGDIDILVQVLGGRPLLLENTHGNKNHWLGLQLTGTKSNRDAIGAAVKVVTTDGASYHFVNRSGSYLSSSDPRILAGMGQQEPVSVEITWPSGKLQKLQKPAYNRYLKITEPE